MSLVYPMFAMVVLTAIVLMVMFRSRVRALKSREVSLSYFQTYSASFDLPEYAVKPARHFVNLFEAPVLFYAGCLAAMAVQVTGPVVIAFAWVYVVCRYLHALIHIRSHNIYLRMYAYAASWVALLGLWASVVLAVS